MDRLTSAERMQALATKGELDRIPIIPLAIGYTARISGMTLKEYYLKPEKAFEAQVWAKELHGYDGNFSFNIPEWGGWDFGGDLRFPSNPSYAPPFLAKRPVADVKDVEQLKAPDIAGSPTLKRLIVFGDMVREKGLSVTIPAGSPIGVVGSITGPDLLLRWFYKEPDLIHRLMRISTDYILNIADTLIDKYTAEACSAFTTFPWECSAIMSPKLFESFSLPYISEIHSSLQRKGVKKWVVHLCGDHSKNLCHWGKEIPVIPRTIFSLSHEMNLKQTGAILGEEHIIGGNIPTTLLQTGTPNEVLTACKEVIEEMKYHPGGFILMPDCALPPLTPPVNVHAMVYSARTYGAYN